MPSEVLIVGDPSGRSELAREIEGLGYAVSICQSRELNRRVRTSSPPTAILACIGDVEPDVLLAGLRRTREGASIPVLLYGRLGGSLRDVAAVLDIGADHFLAEPVSRSDLREALGQYAGVPTREPDRTRSGAPTGEAGELHRTLDRVEARLRTRDDSDPELASLGLDSIPDPDGGELEDDSMPHIGDTGEPIVTHTSDSYPPPRAEQRSRARGDIRTASPSTTERLSEPREATGRSGRIPSNGDPSRASEPARGSAVLKGRRPERNPRAPVRRSIVIEDRGEPWPNDDVEAEGTPTREVPARDRGPIGSRHPSRPESPPRPGRSESELDARSIGERGTVRIDTPPRPLRREASLAGSAWDDPPPRREPTRDSSRVADSVALARGVADRSARVEALDVPALLWQLHQQRFTGRLRLVRQRIEKQLWMESGELVFARSNASSDRLIDGLLRRGVLTQPQYETARRLAAKEPRRAGQLLVDAGFLKPRELEAVLRDHLARVIDSTFTWTEGSYTTDLGERSDEPIRLDVPLAVLLLDGIRHQIDARELEQSLLRSGTGRGPLVPRLIDGHGRDPVEQAASVADVLRLGADEEQILSRLDGRQTAAALIAEGIGEVELFGLLRLLELAGHVDLRGGVGLGLAVSDQPSRAPAQIDTDRILERLRLAREADYFELLGLRRDAASSEIRQAHAEVSTTFAPEALERETLVRHARELVELRAAVDEARDILSDDAMRSAYLAHLPASETELSSRSRPELDPHPRSRSE